MARTTTRTGGAQFTQYFNPVLKAIWELGGSASPSEVRRAIVASLKLSEADQTDTMKSGASRFENQVAWARFYLVKAGLLDARQRGTWALTERGIQIAARPLSDEAVAHVFVAARGKLKPLGDHLPMEVGGDTPAPVGDEALPGQQDHRRAVLEVLGALPPAGFERFCQHLLRASGFEQVTVTGKTADGGIDGFGYLPANLFVSFKVVFQCKRYKGSVSSPAIRDFRGAMAGRSDRGIVLTTGTFSVEAGKEAVREGVPPIELVDGDKLVRMMEKLKIGLVPVQTYVVDTTFFGPYQGGPSTG